MAQTDIVSGFLPQGDIGNKAKSIVLIGVLVIIIFIVVIAAKKGINFLNAASNFGDGVAEFFGLKDRPGVAAAKQDLQKVDGKAGSIDSPFNPTYHRTAPSGVSKLPADQANDLADQVYDSVGWFYDDPEAGLAAIKQARTWVQVSQIADAFNSSYDKDMYAWLKIKYDTKSQIENLTKIVSIPPGEYVRKNETQRN